MLSLSDRYAHDREGYRQRNKQYIAMVQSCDKRVSSSDQAPGWKIMDIEEEIEDVPPIQQEETDTGEDNNPGKGHHIHHMYT